MGRMTFSNRNKCNLYIRPPILRRFLFEMWKCGTKLGRSVVCLLAQTITFGILVFFFSLFLMHLCLLRARVKTPNWWMMDLHKGPGRNIYSPSSINGCACVLYICLSEHILVWTKQKKNISVDIYGCWKAFWTNICLKDTQILG